MTIYVHVGGVVFGLSKVTSHRVDNIVNMHYKRRYMYVGGVVFGLSKVTYLCHIVLIIL